MPTPPRASKDVFRSENRSKTGRKSVEKPQRVAVGLHRQEALHQADTQQALQPARELRELPEHSKEMCKTYV